MRKFKSTPVPEKHITKILEAAHSAPSPHNRQAWKYLVISDRAKIEQLKEECIKETGEGRRKYYTNYFSAPVYIIIFSDSSTANPEADLMAAAISAGYLMLAARALGYGTVYRVNSVPEKIVREFFNIPDNFKRVCITPVGVPESWPKGPSKKGLDKVVVYEKF